VGPSRTRVLFVQGAGVRAGAERALMARLRHLPEHGIDPLVAFLADGPFRGEVERAGVPTLDLGAAPRLRDLARLPAAVRGLVAAARNEGVSVIEGCGEKMSVLAGWAARVARCGSVYNLQDAPARSLDATAAQVAAACGRHDAVVVPSKWMADAFRRRLRLRARVIPNAVVLDELPDEAADVRRLGGWPDDSIVVGFFGRLVRWKGAEVLLRAAREVRAANPRVRLLLAGGSLYGLEPGYEARLRDDTARLGLADSVHFAGHREDALGLMAGCDIVSHCSLEREPFGMAVLEAMALGRPVVASRLGGPAELIDHGRTGRLVDAGDESGLAGELRALAEDPRAAGELGEAARAEVRLRYASDVVAGSLRELYLETAARPQRSAT